MNKKYELIKTYPGSPKLETIIEGRVLQTMIPVIPLENGEYSEFWREVKEKTNYDKFTPPFRIGKKQNRAVLDSKGHEVVIFNEGQEKMALDYCIILNQRLEIFQLLKIEEYISFNNSSNKTCHTNTEKNYRILSRDNNIGIISVQRLLDGEVFKIGDKVTLKNRLDLDIYTIRKIEENETGNIVLFTKDFDKNGINLNKVTKAL